MNNALLSNQIKNELRLDHQVTKFLSHTQSGKIILFIRQNNIGKVRLRAKGKSIHDQEKIHAEELSEMLGLKKEYIPNFLLLFSNSVRRSQKVINGYVTIHFVISDDRENFNAYTEIEEEIHYK